MHCLLIEDIIQPLFFKIEASGSEVSVDASIELRLVLGENGYVR